MAFSKEKIIKILTKKGIDPKKIVTDHSIFNKACNVIYKSTPIPIRWVVGKKRINKGMSLFREELAKKYSLNISKSTTNMASSGRL